MVVRSGPAVASGSPAARRRRASPATAGSPIAPRVWMRSERSTGTVGASPAFAAQPIRASTGDSFLDA
jgi:hypothetical protein